MHKIVLTSAFSRERAARIAREAPGGWTATYAPAKRTLAQNDKMHAMLTDISIAKPQSRNHPPEVWKDIFLAAIGIEAQWVPSLDGTTVVNTARRSSRLNKEQMSDMIEQMYAYGAEHGVRWSEPQEKAA